MADEVKIQTKDLLESTSIAPTDYLVADIDIGGGIRKTRKVKKSLLGGGGSGNVTSSGTVSADGQLVVFSGTSANVLIGYTGTGIAKLAGGVVGTATPGLDYLIATSGTSIQKARSGSLTAAIPSVDYLIATSGSAMQKADGFGGLIAASAGTHYGAPPVVQYVSGNATINQGTTSVLVISGGILQMPRCDSGVPTVYYPGDMIMFSDPRGVLSSINPVRITQPGYGNRINGQTGAVTIMNSPNERAFATLDATGTNWGTDRAITMHGAAGVISLDGSTSKLTLTTGYVGGKSPSPFEVGSTFGLQAQFVTNSVVRLNIDANNPNLRFGTQLDSGIERNGVNTLMVNTGVFGTPGDMKMRQLITDKTMTLSGTTGNVTINKAAGSVRFAASSTSLTLTNSLLTSDSILFVALSTNDSTAIFKNYVCSPGSAVFNLSVAASAETELRWGIIG